MPKDIRTFIDQVARKAPDLIKRVSAECDPEFGVCAVAAKLEQQDQFPALYFDKVKGSSLPLVINLTASYPLLALSLDTTVDRMVETYGERQANPISPVEWEGAEAPVHEIVITGSDLDLGVLPIPHHNELDGGAYITGGCMIMKDPDSDAVNVGLYRHQVQNPQQLGIWVWQGHDADYMLRRYEELNREAEVAIVIGHHPAFVMGAISRLPGIGREFDEAGGLLGEPLELVKAKTVDLRVPARAEIVIEGVIPPGERAEEGPFGEWPGHYTNDGPQPFIKVTAITRRKDAIYHDLFAAHREHTVVGSLPRMGSIYRRVKQIVPGLRQVNVPAHSRMHCYLSIKKTGDAEVKRAALEAFQTEPQNLKAVVVVDDDIDVFRDSEVLWAVGTRCKADTDLLVIPDWADPGGLNPVAYDYHNDGSKTPHRVTAVVIDATMPLPPARYSPRALVPQDYVDQVDLDRIVHDFNLVAEPQGR